MIRFQDGSPMVKLARSEVLPSGVFENSVDLDRALEMLVTKKVLAERLALSQSYINQLMSKEALPHLKIGRAVRFRVREVVAWLQRRRQP